MDENNIIETNETEKIIDTNFDTELKNSYLAYAMSVITDRALPDARDGLKPVQRRILYAMNELHLSPAGPHKKSARIVGETMGKFHPHGDSAIYDAMARMAQDFSLRVPLVDGQGNFGSLDGDAPAAMRYTEARLSSWGESMMTDMDKETVTFIPNFDDSLKEPSVLPCSLPNLLINGTTGIAVGMSTNIPPHNPIEVMDMLTQYVRAGCTWTVDDIVSYVPGPDFPTGGEIVGTSGIQEMYKTGRGKLTLRGKSHVEETKNRFMVVITEIPYGITKERIVTQIATSLDERNIDGVVAVRDESDRTGTRIVVELYKRADPHHILALLHKTTSLTTTFGGNCLALVDGVPRTLTLKDIADIYIGHRREVITRRTRFCLQKAESRLHIVEGLLKALDILDDIISLIRKSKDTKKARQGLMNTYHFSECQANAILELRLARLTQLERKELAKEDASLRKNIKEYTSILESPKKLDMVMVAEFESIKNVLESQNIFARKTTIVPDIPKNKTNQMGLSFNGDMTHNEILPCLVMRTPDGGIKQKFVIKGAFKKREGTYVSSGVVYACTSDGKVYSRETRLIPSIDTRQYIDTHMLFRIDDTDADVVLLSPDIHNAVLFVFSDGKIKRMDIDDIIGGMQKNASRKIFPRSIKKGDMIAMLPCMITEKTTLGLFTRMGKALRIDLNSVSAQGRGGQGVAGINLEKKDTIAGALIFGTEQEEDTTCICFATDMRSGARFALSDLKVQGRGGKGVFFTRGDKGQGYVTSVIAAYESDIIMDGDETPVPMSDIKMRGVSEHTLSSFSSLKGPLQKQPH